MSIDIKCPSGLAGTIRGLTVSEAKILSDRRSMHEGTIANNVLSEAWEHTLDFGMYTMDKIDWELVYVCDRFYAVMMIRVATYGDNYAFKMSCGDCRHPFVWDINLMDLAVKKLPEETKKKIVAKEPLKTYVDGAEVTFQLLTGEKERKLQKALRGSKNKLITSLAKRVISIDGHKNKMLWLNKLPLQSAIDLLDGMDEHDGGVETEIDTICPECGALNQVELPFDRKEFWLPLKTKNLI